MLAHIRDIPNVGTKILFNLGNSLTEEQLEHSLHRMGIQPEQIPRLVQEILADISGISRNCYTTLELIANTTAQLVHITANTLDNARIISLFSSTHPVFRGEESLHRALTSQNVPSETAWDFIETILDRDAPLYIDNVTRLGPFIFFDLLTDRDDSIAQKHFYYTLPLDATNATEVIEWILLACQAYSPERQHAILSDLSIYLGQDFSPAFSINSEKQLTISLYPGPEISFSYDLSTL